MQYQDTAGAAAFERELRGGAGEIFAFCMDRSPRIRESVEKYGGLALEDFVKLQRRKLEANNSLKPLEPREEFLEVCGKHLAERTSGEITEQTLEALSCGALHTADHLGGLYSPQSFQGDLLFDRMLQGIGDFSCIPFFACGLVPLKSSTYARGLMSFSNVQGPEHLPVFSTKEAYGAASFLHAYDQRLLDQALSRCGKLFTSEKAAECAKGLLRKAYAAGEALSCSRYADQILHLYIELSKLLEPLLEGKRYICMETEAIAAALLKKDLEKPDSLISLILFDPAVRSEFNEERDEEGMPLSSLLFRGWDDLGRLHPVLNLEPEGSFSGRSMKGERVLLPGDKASVLKLVKERVLMPGTYLEAVLYGFSRGFTWYGGIFQSVYLPKWQAMTVRALKRSGYPDLAEKIGLWELSGYMSGPVFALESTGSGAVSAGPIEFLIHGTDRAALDRYIKTDVCSSHFLGLFEFYHDLTVGSERRDGWYEEIAEFAGRNFSDNLL